METLNSIHESMIRELADRGAVIDDVFACPHATDSCDCRKPKPGMIRGAFEKWDIDPVLDRSWLVIRIPIRSSPRTVA